MKLKYATGLAKVIIKHNPDYVLCGSAGLIISGALKDRDIHDLDFICRLSDFELGDRHTYGNYGPDEYDDYTCYKIQGDTRWGFYYNVFVFKDDRESKYSIVDGIPIQPVADMLFWKNSFNREKDRADLKNLTKPMAKEKFNDMNAQLAKLKRQHDANMIAIKNRKLRLENAYEDAVEKIKNHFETN